MRNQFQSLDEDDVEFLDSVLESTRAAEAAVKKQTREQLELFKRQQEEAELAARGKGEPDAVPEATESWTVSRKRKKGRDDVLGKVKLRKASSGAKETPPTEAAKEKVVEASSKSTASTGVAPKTAPVETASQPAEKVKESPKPSTSPTLGLGLGLDAYSSDDD